MSGPLLIVGNGPSADTPAVAAAVLAAPCVMRLNAFPPGQHLGTRCDIWGSSLDHEWRTPPPGVSRVWWSAHPYCPNQAPCNYGEILARQLVVCERIAPQSLLDRLALLFAPASPSTGAIMVALALAAGYQVTLAGFDHFAGDLAPLHYHADGFVARHAVEFHDPRTEALVLSFLPTIGGPS